MTTIPTNVLMRTKRDSGVATATVLLTTTTNTANDYCALAWDSATKNAAARKFFAVLLAMISMVEQRRQTTIDRPPTAVNHPSEAQFVEAEDDLIRQFKRANELVLTSVIELEFPGTAELFETCTGRCSGTMPKGVRLPNARSAVERFRPIHAAAGLGFHRLLRSMIAYGGPQTV